MSPDDAVAAAHAAVAHAAAGRLREAEEEINRIPLEVRRDPAVWPHFISACGAVQEVDALLALRALWEVYVWADEPLKARELLRMVPVASEGNPMVEEMRRLTEEKLAFLSNWESYCKVYGAADFDGPMYELSEEDRRGFLDQERVKFVLDWFAANPGAHRVLAIGAQGCVLERELLSRHAGVVITVSDVNPRARRVAAELACDFPARVRVHEPQAFDDWIRYGDHIGYDAVLMLEVIEHLPDQRRALARVHDVLRPFGTLLLSTPYGGLGANTRLTREPDSHAQWGHVRAQRPEGLLDELRRSGFDAEVSVVDGGLNMVARACR